MHIPFFVSFVCFACWLRILAMWLNFCDAFQVGTNCFGGFGKESAICDTQVARQQDRKSGTVRHTWPKTALTNRHTCPKKSALRSSDTWPKIALANRHTWPKTALTDTCGQKLLIQTDTRDQELLLQTDTRGEKLLLQTGTRGQKLLLQTGIPGQNCSYKQPHAKPRLLSLLSLYHPRSLSGTVVRQWDKTYSFFVVVVLGGELHRLWLHFRTVSCVWLVLPGILPC